LRRSRRTATDRASISNGSRWCLLRRTAGQCSGWRAGKPPIPAETVARVVALTCGEPPAGATHWTGRAATKAVGVSLRSVQRIWQAHQLQPHRVRSFKRSRDPQFAEKMTDIVGLYLDPPAHTVVLSIDEKSQIQALDRTQPGLPLKPGRCRRTIQRRRWSNQGRGVFLRC
jgi:hypothetical protein